MSTDQAGRVVDVSELQAVLTLKSRIDKIDARACLKELPPREGVAVEEVHQRRRKNHPAVRSDFSSMTPGTLQAERHRAKGRGR